MTHDKCPTCGSSVRIEGNTTKYFVPIDGRAQLLRELAPVREALEYYSNENSWYLNKDAQTGAEVRRSIELSDTETGGRVDDFGNNILTVRAGKHARGALALLEDLGVK